MQAKGVTEKSSKEEIDEAFIDWGITQGIINALKKLCLISKQEYESLSNQQKAIREYLNALNKKEDKD